MPDEANDPATAPLPPDGPANDQVVMVLPANKPSQSRVALLLGVGGAVGLALGILLTIGVYATYTLFTQTLPSTVESVQVFNELNELRQEINAMNEEKKLKEMETAEAMRKALNTVASTAPGKESKPPEMGPAVKKKERKPPGVDPFADIDAEIEDLERTQKTLNTILDLFTPKRKDQVKDDRTPH